MARHKAHDPDAEPVGTTPGKALTEGDIVAFLSSANDLAGERSEINAQMSELVKGLTERGGNRQALVWIRKLDRMSDQDALGVVEALATYLEMMPSFGAQGDLLRRIQASKDKTAPPAPPPGKVLDLSSVPAGSA